MHHMTNDTIRREQNKILFRGDTNTLMRHITKADLEQVRRLDILYLANLAEESDEQTKRRAIRTIYNLRQQIKCE